jgi:hypothetical protein
MSDTALMTRIESLLADGLQTASSHRAYDSDQVAATCQKLQRLPADDLESKLVVAGFMLKPFVHPDDADGIEQSCATCMYFERHRKFCDLPELMLPVEPEWSCILWRI